MNHSKKCSPAIRIKGFTDDWEQRKLGDLGNVVMCKRIFKHQTNEKAGIPFYKIGTFSYVADAYISHSLYNEYKTKYPYPKEGDILISAAGTIGRTITYNGEKAYYQDSNIVWLNIDKRKISNIFLKYFYKIAKWNGIEGSTIQRLYNFNILSTNINLPSLKEQTQIGNFFKQLDETIALHKRTLEKHQNLKKFYLEKMFPKENQQFPEIRFPNFTDAWEQRKLGEVLSLLKDGTHGTHQDVKNGIYLLSAKNIKNGKIIIDANDRQISIDEYEKIHSTFKLQNGDILLTIVGTIGDSAILVNPKGITFQRSVAYLRSEILTPDFLHSLITSPNFQNKLKNKQVTSAQSGVYLGDLSNITIFYPKEKEEQTQIGSFFKQLDETIALHKRKVEKFEKIKQAYLEKMFI